MKDINIEEAECSECYIPNNNPYPLCKGDKNALYNCEWCCLYEDYVGDEPPME